MQTIPFALVDVFTPLPYTGNPLALLDCRFLTSPLTTTQHQLIARQFNLSETTFILKPTLPATTAYLRSFLPNGKEVFGTGHNILGAWWWIAANGLLDGHPGLSVSRGKAGVNEIQVHQQLGPDVLPVRIERRHEEKGAFRYSVTLEQQSPRFYGVHEKPDGVAEGLGIAAVEMGFGYAEKRIEKAQVVSTSSSRHLLVPVKDEDVLEKVSFTDKEKLIRELREADEAAYGIYVFTPSTSTSRSTDAESEEATSTTLSFQARFFSPGMSSEDPATGSAAGPLAAYLFHHGMLSIDPGTTKRVMVLQGKELGRRCVMEVGVTDPEEGGVDSKDEDENRDGGLKISISGEAVEVGRGEIVVPDVNITF